MQGADSLRTPVSHLAVRRLGPADLPACLALAVSRDWGREEHKWRFLLRNGEGFGIDAPGGGLAGTVLLTRYGDTAAAISMMLVDSRHAGRGLGRRLMTEAVRAAGDVTVFLYATEFGRPLYEKLGFATVTVAEARVGRVRIGDDRPRSRPADPDRDLPALLALDAEVFGADRSALLTRLFTFGEQVRVAERAGRIIGYAGAWRNIDTLVIGPVVADGEETARGLIADLARDETGPVRIEVDRRRPELISWIAERGVPLAFSTSFMVMGGRPLPGDRSRLIAPFMSALG